MYVRDTDPLPRNSMDPVYPCEIARGREIVQGVEQSVANAQNASAQIAGPGSFMAFGPAVVIDVARSQNAMVAANRTTSQPRASQYSDMASAPQMVPLSVGQAEYNGCAFRTGAILPAPAPPQPAVVMPQRAPAPVVVPQFASAPKYANLCWAMRNGMVDQSQFDPSEFMALSLRCTQLGYAGACFPPPNTALWLDQQRRAGTLPHISVSSADLDALPQAPDLTGVDCTKSYALGGMAGYRGMGAAWGDAGSVPAVYGWPEGTANASAVNWKAVLIFGVLGVGLYWAGNHGRK